MAPSALNSNGLVDGLPSGDYNGHNENYTVTEEPLGTPRYLRVIALGAGASGLNLARHVDLHMKNVELIVYEKNADVGGTWLENKYPGCGCDIPSHSYQFTWEPNPNWSKFYSDGPEIWQYFKQIATKYDLYRFIRFRQRVNEAVWCEQKGTWALTIEDLETGELKVDWCHVVINSGGILNRWKWPDIPGLQSYRGTLMHTAAWNESHDLTGKTVAVLGSSSSAAQAVPAIQPYVKQLTTFIRTPIWITPGFGEEHAGPGGTNFAFSEKQKEDFRNDPERYMAYRKQLEGHLNTRFRFILADGEQQQEARRVAAQQMKMKLGPNNEQLLKHMVPTFPLGCRRPVPGHGYLEALTRANVRVVTDRIKEIVPEGIKLVTGEVVQVDTFICATGFDLSYIPRCKFVGREGVLLSEQWAEKPEAYMAIGVENFPNYFMFFGPNYPVGHGSALPIIEHTTKYMINMMKKMQTQNIQSVHPSPAAIREFSVHKDEFMKRTAWAAPCRSWFKQGGLAEGPIVALHPGSRLHWFHLLRDIRYEDWEYKYLTPNRFQYLGDGFSTTEAPGLDTTYYFDDPESGYKDY